MKQKNFHTIYTAADIQKYLEGKLSVAEMHALEKAALDDPLLADAIEGMEIGSVHYQEDVQRLRDKVFQKRKRSIVIAWSGAAAVITLAIYGIFLFNQQKPVSKQGALATTTIVSKHKQKTAATIIAVVPHPHKIITASPAKKPVNHVYNLKKDSLPPSDSASVQIIAYGTTKKRFNVGSVSTIKAADIEKQPVTNPLVALEGRVPGMLIQQTYGIKDTTFRGYIKDNKGMPVVGALVRIAKSKATTVSDETGAFTLKANRRDSSIQVHVSSIGYQPVDKMLALSNKYNDVVLNPALSSLDEVSVKGYYSKGVEKEADSTIAANAQPEKGWKAYKRYLKKQKRKDPEDVSKTGTVIVRFHVDSIGNISDFHIDQSLSSFYDNEAIRLIKEGPGWKIKQGEKEEVVLRVGF